MTVMMAEQGSRRESQCCSCLPRAGKTPGLGAGNMHIKPWLIPQRQIEAEHPIHPDHTCKIYPRSDFSRATVIATQVLQVKAYRPDTMASKQLLERPYTSFLRENGTLSR